MPTQTAPTPLTVVPGPDVQQAFANTFYAPAKLSEAIENFERQRAEAKNALARSLAEDFAVDRPNVAGAITRYQNWETSDKTLVTKIEVCRKLRCIIEEHIEDLKRTRRDEVKAFLKGKLYKLEAERASEEVKETFLQGEIKKTRDLLQQLEKPPYAASAKRKKK
jgi:hypothetical protein